MPMERHVLLPQTFVNLIFSALMAVNSGFMLSEEVHKNKLFTVPQSQAVQYKVFWAEQVPGKTLCPGSGRVSLCFACQLSVRQQKYIRAGRMCCCGWVAFSAHTSLHWCVCLYNPQGVHPGMWHLGGVPFVDHGVIYLCGPFCPVSFTAPVCSQLGTYILHVLSQLHHPTVVGLHSSISFIVDCVSVCGSSGVPRVQHFPLCIGEHENPIRLGVRFPAFHLLSELHQAQLSWMCKG